MMAEPLMIGQACEFDYSGAQACKALKEEGYKNNSGKFQSSDNYDGSKSRRQDI